MPPKNFDMNPYLNRQMLRPDSDMFIGRQQDMKTIRGFINNVQSVSIVGEQRIGKSSLACRLYNEFKDIDKKIVIYIDCDAFPELSTKEDFCNILNDKFKNALLYKKIQTEQNLFDSFFTFEEFIKKNAQHGVTIILFFDEFEKLVDMPCADDKFFSFLKSIADNSLYNLAYVTISTQNLEKLIPSHKFYRFFYKHILKVIDESAIKTLREKGFKKAGLQLTNEDNTLIHEFAGNFPFFNQIVCFYLFEAKVLNIPIDKNQILNDLIPYYRALWDDRTREEQKLLKKISHPYIFKQEVFLNEMMMRGLVHKENDYYFIFSKFFNDLIQRSFEVKKNDAWGIGLGNFLSKTTDILGLIKNAKEITQ